MLRCATVLILGVLISGCGKAPAPAAAPVISLAVVSRAGEDLRLRAKVEPPLAEVPGSFILKTWSWSEGCAHSCNRGGSRAIQDKALNVSALKFSPESVALVGDGSLTGVQDGPFVLVFADAHGKELWRSNEIHVTRR